MHRNTAVARKVKAHLSSKVGEMCSLPPHSRWLWHQTSKLQLSPHDVKAEFVWSKLNCIYELWHINSLEFYTFHPKVWRKISTIYIQGLLDPLLQLITLFNDVPSPPYGDHQRMVGLKDSWELKEWPAAGKLHSVFFFLIKKHQNELEIGKTSREKPGWLWAQFARMGWTWTWIWLLLGLWSQQKSICGCMDIRWKARYPSLETPRVL